MAGHLLMILAIVVDVVGICYASRQKEKKKKVVVERGEVLSDSERLWGCGY